MTKLITFVLLGENPPAEIPLVVLKTPPFDLYAVFTVQEEVGIRGANVAAQEIQPDFGFGLDTTIAFDVPGSSPHEQITKLC